MTPDTTPVACSLDREFPFPADQVFDAWTDASLLARWWGPEDFKTSVCEFEARPGGGIRIDLRAPDGVVYPMTGAVEEIEVPGRLVFTSAALDDTGRAMLKLRTTVECTSHGSWTSLSLRVHVIEKTSAAARLLAGMEAGWSLSFVRLEALLGDLREIVTSRVFPAPRAVLFEAFRNPQQLVSWWGPKGFRNTFDVFEPKSGGRWRFTMHGPNGTSYPNEKDFIAVVPEERIVFKHIDPVHGFRMTMIYQDEAGGTRLTWRMRFESEEQSAKMADLIAEKNEENFDRLEEHLMHSGMLAG